jgi:hypothetical protein
VLLCIHLVVTTLKSEKAGKKKKSKIKITLKD